MTSKIQKQIKHWSIFSKVAIIATLLFACTSLAFISARADDAWVNNLQAEKDAQRRKLIEVQNEVRQLQTQINEQRGKIASLNNELKLFDLQIQQTEKQIEAYNAEIEVVNLDIIDTLNQIAKTEKDIDSKKQQLVALIRQMHEQDETSPLEIVLTNGNLSDFLTVVQTTFTLQNKNQELLNDLTGLKDSLESKQAVLKKNRADLEVLKVAAESTVVTLADQRAQKSNLLSYTRGVESRYQALLSEVSEEESRIQREIFELDLAIREKLGDKSLPTITGGLSWPMDGILTQGYGNTGFTKLGYTFHNGIDIAAAPHTPVHSAGDGIVYSTDSSDAAYGNWVVVRHTLQSDSGQKDVYTLYAHLSHINVSPGQPVLAGDTLGLQGNSGNTTKLLYGPERGYHLHFSVFDEDGFGIKKGTYGSYRIPYGYTYNPMSFLK